MITIITNPNPKVVKDHAKCMLHMLLLTNEIPNLELKLSIAYASFYVLLRIKRISTSSLSSFRQGGSRAEQAGWMAAKSLKNKSSCYVLEKRQKKSP